jgi:hypothetical protein
MRTRTLVQVLSTAAIVAVLAWECAAAGRVPGSLSPAALSDSLVARDADRPQTAILGARF